MSSDNKPPHNSGARPVGARPSPPSKDLATRVAELERFIRDQFDETNQWNSTLRGWIGQNVRIRLLDGETISGILKWVDRYTMCLCHSADILEIVHKGAIATIRKH